MGGKFVNSLRDRAWRIALVESPTPQICGGLFADRQFGGDGIKEGLIPANPLAIFVGVIEEAGAKFQKDLRMLGKPGRQPGGRGLRSADDEEIRELHARSGNFQFRVGWCRSSA